ncbi:hypothetical protein L6164_021004 [Bauhinia variegata]|uniref:Uncharacterized protein n=1 Tax=Bauhinia variegata TaxID=167791 RepID=A0ACB9MYV7_BAUVA|nr:hypothetical protein L6164_021004 [Bauhinia variegata]
MPSYLKDYYVDLPSSHMATSTVHPLSKFLLYSHLSPHNKSFSLKVLHSSEPNSFKEATQSQYWQDTMALELWALEHNNTWEVVPLLVDRKPVGSKWVYKIKYNLNGSIERYKAKLVAKRLQPERRL